MRILITGVKSGLGKAAHERFGGRGLALTRSERARELEEVGGSEVDVIIHCAANPARVSGTEGMHHYFEDNVLLAGRVAAIPATAAAPSRTNRRRVIRWWDIGRLLTFYTNLPFAANTA